MEARRKHTKVTKAMVDDWVAKVKGGMSMAEVARQSGVSNPCVHRRLTSLGIRSAHKAGGNAHYRPGDVKIDSNGYRRVYRSDLGPISRGGFNYWHFEHRVAASEMLSRALLPGEEVHHIDRCKANNAPNNLVVFSSSKAHTRHHWRVGEILDDTKQYCYEDGGYDSPENDPFAAASAGWARETRETTTEIAHA